MKQIIIVAAGAFGLGFAVAVAAMLPRERIDHSMVERCRREVSRVAAFGPQERARFAEMRGKSSAAELNWQLTKWIAAFNSQRARPLKSARKAL